MGSVSLPLKWKIIGANTFLLLVTIILLVQFATTLFNEDKSATIYESTLESGISLASRFENYASENKRTFDLLLKLSQSKNLGGETLKAVFSKNPSLVAVASWQGSKDSLLFYLENDLYLGSHSLKKGVFLDEMGKWQTPQGSHQRVRTKNEWSSEFKKKLDRPHWQMSFVGKGAQENERVKMAALFHLENPLKELSRDSLFSHFIYWKGILLATKEGDSILYESSLKNLVQNSQAGAGQVKRMISAAGDYLVGLIPIEGQSDVYALSVIEERVIFRASSFLREQSIYFGLFVLALTVFVGVLMSRSMTTNLARLHEASLAFAKGHFQQELPIKSKDEIGTLAVTFKKMGQDILRYIEEMKDKARMEKEMEVARLVQESFIPQNELSFHQIKLSSYYRPTSECSGDWWGSFTFGDSMVLVVADATGHGVPAALMTATASGCLHQLEYELINGLRKEISACEVLQVMNFSLCRMGGKIHMTAFAMVINTKTGASTYSNASHNPPLFISGALSQADGTSDLTKENLVPLMEAQGSRLGEGESSQYPEKIFQLEEGDFIYIYSDGLVEQVGDEGKAFGQRRFYKEFLDYLNRGEGQGALSGVSRHLLAKLQEFSGRQDWDDDITLLSLGFFEGELSQNETSRYQFLEEDEVLISSLSNDKIYGELFKDFAFKGVFTSLESWQEFNSLDPLEFLKSYGELLDEKSFEVYSSDQLESLLISTIESSNDEGYFESPKTHFSLMARELVSNALYHQSEETAVSERKGGISLPLEKAVHVNLFWREGALGVIVKDKSGRLTYEALRKSLIRSYKEKTPEEKEGGAGLGLYMVFENANNIFLNVKTQEETTIVALIEKERRYKNYRAKTTQFYFREQKS